MKHLLTFLARLGLSFIFIMSGFTKITNFEGTAQKMTQAGMPAASFFLVGAIGFLLMGGLAVLLGFKAKWGAILLLLFLIPATFIFHLDITDPMQRIQLVKNIAIGGGLLMLIAHGSGKFSVDRNP